MKTVHLLIKGKVQGVFYRATAKVIAHEIGLKGWIKNTQEGNVEAIVSGDAEQVEKFIQWCRQGPARAEVTDIIITDKEYEQFEEFKVIRGK